MIILRTILLKHYNGMTLWPFLLVSNRQDVSDKIFINHENIHAAQQKELLIIFFYLWYAMDYLRHRITKSHHAAYRSIVFEREAYAMESNMDYLKTRRTLAFLSFYKRER